MLRLFKDCVCSVWVRVRRYTKTTIISSDVLPIKSERERTSQLLWLDWIYSVPKTWATADMVSAITLMKRLNSKTTLSGTMEPWEIRLLLTFPITFHRQGPVPASLCTLLYWVLHTKPVNPKQQHHEDVFSAVECQTRRELMQST